MNLRRELDRRVREALVAAGAPEDTPALVGPSTRPDFGDYQANGCMAAAKKLKTNPRELAGKVVDALDVADLAEKVEVAGPGFINITLRPDFLADLLQGCVSDQKLGVAQPEKPETVVVDYCAPNLAKEMHVGHLRSTIIGDALSRVLEFTGHDVARQNHVGDWGTQFGMLTAYMEEQFDVFTEADAADGGKFEFTEAGEIGDMEEFYRRAKVRFDEDPGFADKAREYVVKLQSGDPRVLKLWEIVREHSLQHAQAVCDRLGTKLTRDDVRGESAYNDDLPRIVEELDARGLLAESQGARVVFLDEFTNKEGDPLPVIIQKTGGGYLYATTDLAALRHRARELNADRVLYVVDARQSLHFQQVFSVARKAGFVGEEISLEHVPFGMMLGEDGRPFKTRQGGTVKLADLLDEAVRRARQLVDDKNPDLPADRRGRIAEAVGIGAVKYADLSQNRASDYVFSWGKMLSLEGNTAPYMQYAYARVRSIYRKGGLDSVDAADISLDHPAERGLALILARLPEAIETVAADCTPHVLCGYLFDLAGAFMGFYENCPVLKADSDARRASRLALCDLTARTISTGLGLLGIETLEQM